MQFCKCIWIQVRFVKIEKMSQSTVKKLLIYTALLFLLNGCAGSSGSDSSSGSAVSVVQSGDRSALISWNSPTRNTDDSVLTDLTGFKIYYGMFVGDYDNSITKYHLYSYVFFKNNFARSLYHIFYSSCLLHEHNISFTPNNDDPFISYQDNLPILNEFSYSFYFSKINIEHLEHLEHLEQYFPIQLLNNTYISIDVFIITYMLHHNIKHLTETYSIQIINTYVESREKIDINSLKQIITYFHGYDSLQIIQYLFQFKYMWTYYSLCYYFVLHHPVLLKHFSLFDLFSSYIRSNFKERDSNIISSIHCRLFG